MKFASFVVALVAVCASGRAAENCDPNTMIPIAEMRKNAWVGFHGVITSVDTAAGAIGVKMNDGQYAVYVTGGTIICNHDRSGKLADAKIGDVIGGITKLTNGRSVAIRIGIGITAHPYGIPVPNKPGFLTSPYAPNAGYIDVRGFPRGRLVRDPFTNKTLTVP